jgi:hypothetical protein
MTTELATKSNSYAARYADTKDPYAAFANESGPGIQGRLLVLQQG